LKCSEVNQTKENAAAAASKEGNDEEAQHFYLFFKNTLKMYNFQKWKFYSHLVKAHQTILGTHHKKSLHLLPVKYVQCVRGK